MLIIKDIRNSIQKHPTKKPSYRKLSDIKYINIHHSLTTDGGAEAFARYHVGTKGWSVMGYTYVILKNGIVQFCSDWNVITPHVGNSNRESLGICMVGDFRTQEPTKEQYEALYNLIERLQKELGISTKNIRGHQEMPSYSWKQCPALDMDSLRGNIEKKNYKPVKNNFNNDSKIEFKYPPVKVYETIEEKGDDLLMLENYQWTMLEMALKEFHDKGILNDDAWAKKAANKSLSMSELAFLNTILIQRNLFGK